jgi:hypothetical protein
MSVLFAFSLQSPNVIKRESLKNGGRIPACFLTSEGKKDLVILNLSSTLEATPSK